MPEAPAIAEPVILTTAAFHAAALAAVEATDSGRRIAVFDCDGTLWSGDAGSGFMHWTIDHAILSPEAITWINDKYQGYLAGRVDEFAICGQMVQVYRGLTETALRAAAADFFAAEIEHRIFPELRALIAGMQSRGVEIWAVSSTNDWVIEEGIRRFGIPASRVLCARVAVENGIITDRILDVPTDEGKAAALARAGIPAPHAVFGNSIHDAAMLEIAQKSGSFPVNPTPSLINRAALHHWPIYYPASVTPSSQLVPVAGASAGEPRG